MTKREALEISLANFGPRMGGPGYDRIQELPMTELAQEQWELFLGKSAAFRRAFLSGCMFSATDAGLTLSRERYNELENWLAECTGLL